MYVRSLTTKPNASTLWLVGQIQRSTCFGQFYLLKYSQAHVYITGSNFHNTMAEPSTCKKKRLGEPTEQMFTIWSFTEQTVNSSLNYKGWHKAAQCHLLAATRKIWSCGFHSTDTCLSSPRCSQSETGEASMHFGTVWSHVPSQKTVIHNLLCAKASLTT